MHIFLFWLLLVFFGVFCDKSYALNTDSVFFIDKVGDNWLFRGNSPVTGGVFDYKFLDKAVREEAFRAKGIHMPEKIFFVDVNFLSEENENNILECSFFNKYSDKGIFWHWPVFNTPDPAKIRVFDKRVDNIVPNDGKLFGLMYSYEYYYPQHLQMLIKAMHDTYEQSRVFYIHCDSGCDRISEIVGAYRMQKIGMNLRESYRVTSKECAGMHYFSKIALEWYCYYLRDYEGIECSCILD